jgi:hypothetical protein
VRTYNPDKKDQRQERDLFQHRLFRDQLQPIAEMIAMLRAAAAPEHYRQLHSTLLGRVLGAEQFAEQLGSKKLAVRAEIAAAKASAPSGPAVRHLSGEIKGLDGDLRCVKAVLSIYRTIGDSIVWKLMDYQRELIAPLGDGERVGHLAAGTGLEAELAEIEWLWNERGVFALHADLTNCVRHGDVLSVEAWNPKTFRLSEIKAAGAARPDSKQMVRLRRWTELANRGFHPEAADGGPLSLRRCPVPHRTHLPLLQAALEIATTETYTSLIPEPGLLIEVYDDSNPAGLSEDDVRNRERASRRGIGPEADLLSYSIYNRRLRDRVQSFSGLAPLPLLPLRLDRLAELLLGRFDIVTSIDAASLERRLSEAGIKAEVARGEEAGERFLGILLPASTLVVPAPVREQVSIEMMRIDTLIETLSWLLGDLASHDSVGPAVSLSNMGEESTWTSYS